MKTTIKILKSDITKLAVDAIVNAANSSLLGGGGVDGAIHAAAGRGLYDECETLHGCATGKAKITKGYDLPAKHVIHTVGPIYGRENGEEARLLADCYRNCLELAKRRGLKSIAFPAISTGAFRYPKEDAAKIAMGTVKAFIKDNPDALDEVVFVLYDQASFEIYEKSLDPRGKPQG